MQHIGSRTSSVISKPLPLRFHYSPSLLSRKPVLQSRRQWTTPCGSLPLFAADDWPLWSALVGLAYLGDFTGKSQIGKLLSTPVLLMLFGFSSAVLGLLPVTSSSYNAVWNYGVPLSTVLYLIHADFDRSAAWVVPVFSLGAAGTVVGTIVAWFLCGRYLGPEGRKIASAFCATYIGGSVNFIAILSALELQKGSLIVAAMTVDNIVMMIYLTIISLIKDENAENNYEPEVMLKKSQLGEKTSKGDFAKGSLVLGVLLGLLCCAFGKSLASLLNIPHLSIAFMALLASTCSMLIKRKNVDNSIQSCKEIGNCIMSVFFVVIGASSGSVQSVLVSTPWMFLFATIQLSIHLLFMLSFAWFFKIPIRQILTASNANIGGPSTAAGCLRLLA
eukprot:g3313.t1